MLSHRFKTILCHIPKTAGESILRVFVQNHGLEWEGRGDLLLKYNPNRERGPERLTHLFAQEYVSLGHIQQSLFESYFKFSTVRNPYDRTISEYRFRYPQVDCTIERFLESLPDDPYDDRVRHMAPQVDFVSDLDGRVIVDQILRFEKLDVDVPRVLLRIFGHPQPFQCTNQSSAPPVMEISDRARQLIYRRFESDFDIFRYPR